MISHFFKLVWNRRRTNTLIFIELLLSFLVLCSALTMACYYALNWNDPLGFSYDDLWRMDISIPEQGDIVTRGDEEGWENINQIDLFIRGMDEIRASTPMTYCFPYTNTYSGYSIDLNGNTVTVAVSPISPSGLEALDLQLLAGRWLEPGDNELNWMPVVITGDYAKARFGNEDPIGKSLEIFNENGQPEERQGMGKERRVVGVVAEYKLRSELRPAYMTEFSSVDMKPGKELTTVFAIRTFPGASTAFEEKLIRAIQQIEPAWTVTITPASRLRARELRSNLLPLTILSIVSMFLIVMVGLGLVGVLWQAVTRRTEEMGLRRALGATASAVRRQILGELLVLTTMAAFVGSVIYMQMPILNVIRWLPWEAYLMALVSGIVILYPVVILCGLYPSWLATRVHPAEALQYE